MPGLLHSRRKRSQSFIRLTSCKRRTGKGLITELNGNHIVDSPRSNLDNAEGVRNFSPGLSASARYPGKWHNRPRCNPEGVAERRARANSFRVYANSWLLVPRALPWARISERLSALITLSDFSGESTTCCPPKGRGNFPLS